MALTRKQERFCEEYVKCGNAAEAYRRAYKTDKMKSVTVWNESSKLMDNHDVTMRIKTIQDAAAKEAQVTLEGHLNKLAELRDMAISDGLINAAITAEVSRGKAAGLYTDRLKADVAQDVKVILFGGE